MAQTLIDGLYRVLCPVDGAQADMRVTNHLVVSCSHASELAACPADCHAKEHLRDPERGHRIGLECPDRGVPAEVFVRQGQVESCSLNPNGCAQRCLRK